MSKAHLIPPKRSAPSARTVAIAAAVGAIAGAVGALFAWALTGNLNWFFLVLIGALVGAWLRRQRPNVLWGQNAH
jgi:uncharacterized membrane protein YfcA